MTECAFCFALSTDGEPTKEYRITGSGERNYRWLCDECANQLGYLGLTVSET